MILQVLLLLGAAATETEGRRRDPLLPGIANTAIAAAAAVVAVMLESV